MQPGDESFVRLAGWAGVLCFGLYIVAFALYLAAGPPPPFADAPQFARYVHDHGALVIAASVAFALDFTLLVVWFLGVRDLVRAAGGQWHSVADLFMTSYVIALAIALVGVGTLIAAATDAAAAGDTYSTRGLWGAGFSILGAVDYLPLGLTQAVYAFAIQRTGALPRWNAWLGWLAAAGSFAAVPTAFGGSGFYSQLGLAPLLLNLPALAWSLGAAVCMIRRRA